MSSNYNYEDLVPEPIKGFVLGQILILKIKVTVLYVAGLCIACAVSISYGALRLS